MQRRRPFRILTAFIALMLLWTAGAALADGGTLTYEGTSVWGRTVDGTAIALMEVSDGDESYPAYCLDKTVVIADGSTYTRTNLSEAQHLPEGAAAKIRAIVTNALPVVSCDALSAMSGVENLSGEEAVTAAQLAIWHAVTGETHSQQSKRIEALYDYYLALPPLSEPVTPIGEMDVKTVYEERGDGVRATFEYCCKGWNADGSELSGCYAFSRDLQADYQARIEESKNGDWNVVTVSGLPADAAFTFETSADQAVVYDAYYYEPTDGRESSQCLVGAYQGSTTIEKSVPYRFVPDEGFSLRILKIDSGTSIGLAGAVFEVSDTEDFSGVIYEITTDAEGRASIAGLREGTYYVREKTPPPGYIPYEGVFPVEVNVYTREQLYKNTAYGGIELHKFDEDDNPVEGAVFSIYAGEEADPDHLIAEGLKTNEAGLIPISNLVPGTYTLVETEPREGYHLNSTPATITLAPGQIGRVEIENIKIKLGRLNLYKRDAETTEQLADAVIGVFTDAACTEEVGRFITDKTEPVSTEELMPGTYYVQELQAPEGYYHNDEIQRVELPEGETVPVTIYNSYIPRTAGNYGLLLAIGGGALIACIAVAYVFRKKLFGPEA